MTRRKRGRPKGRSAEAQRARDEELIRLTFAANAAAAKRAIAGKGTAYIVGHEEAASEAGRGNGEDSGGSLARQIRRLRKDSPSADIADTLLSRDVLEAYYRRVAERDSLERELDEAEKRGEAAFNAKKLELAPRFRAIEAAHPLPIPDVIRRQDPHPGRRRSRKK